MTDSLSDFVIRIKNASLAKRHFISTPYSNLGRAISKVLIKEHFLEDCKEEVKNGKKTLKIKLRFEKRQPVMTDLELISRPSLQVHVKAKGFLKKAKGIGISVLSTSKGVMTQKEARKKGVGGKLLFRVW